MEYELLSHLKLPEDIKKLDIKNKERLCCEARNKIIETVSQNGGHLASNLGVVELTLACHSVFDSPDDKIIFDVGHQSYVHKLFTGRYDRFDTLRKKDGISGFSCPCESVHDHVISGHSSNSVSAALGIAQAMKLNGDKHHAVAIIGDGALTGGLAYEGLNNAGRSETNLVVILNYNEMSISKNIGGIAKYLSELRTRSSYKNTKTVTKRVLESIPLIGKPAANLISNTKKVIKEDLIHSTLFEDLGFEFVGPVDGHDIQELEKALTTAKEMNRPVLVEVITSKGKGYKPAELAPGEYHGVTSFEKTDGSKPQSGETYADHMGKTLASLARNDGRICAITAAMKHAVGLKYFDGDLKPRLFDVGIAEEHAVTFAAGLATSGMIPVFCVYSSFLQRAYDQLIHDAAISNKHIVICIGNAGFVGEDGQTHQGLFDIPMLATIPNTTVYSPSNCAELDLCLNKAIYDDDGIVCIRYPKGEVSHSDIVPTPDYMYTQRGSNELIVSFGRVGEFAQNVANQLNCDCLRLVKLFPISEQIKTVLAEYDKVYVFEESSIQGGIGQMLSQYTKNIEIHGVSGFVPHMTVREALKLYSLDEDEIAETVRKSNEPTT